MHVCGVGPAFMLKGYLKKHSVRQGLKSVSHLTGESLSLKTPLCLQAEESCFDFTGGRAFTRT